MVEARARAALSAVAPGLPQLLAGRWRAGAAAFTVWVALLGLAGSRPSRVGAALAGGWDDRLALASLALGLAGVWTWSWLDVRGRGRSAAPTGWWSRALRTFANSPAAMAGLATVVSLSLMALLAPLLAPFDPYTPGALVAERLLAPSGVHPMGTDQAARDVLSRLLYGARVSLTIGVLGAALAVTLGTLIGAVAGYLGGLVDSALMRLVDVMIAFPRIVLLITVVAFFRPGVAVLVGVIGLTMWPGAARLVRGEVLSLREREFILAARALGFRRRRIILRHVVPNVLAPVIVAVTLGVGDTIVLEAGLSFLGLGVQPPIPSWGSMVADGRADLLGAWWLSTFPGLAIVVTVLAFNLVGDGLRDALDPRLSG